MRGVDHGLARVNADDLALRDVCGERYRDASRPAANVQDDHVWLEEVREVAAGVGLFWASSRVSASSRPETGGRDGAHRVATAMGALNGGAVTLRVFAPRCHAVLRQRTLRK